MAIVLFDNRYRNSLFPLTYTRAVAGLRMGIFTMQERWERLAKQPVLVHTENYLQGLYAAINKEEHTWIDASVLPDDALVNAILNLASGTCIMDEEGLIAGKNTIAPESFNPGTAGSLFGTSITHARTERIRYPWHILQRNDAMIRKDYALVTRGRTSQPIPSSVNAIQPEHIFIEEGVSLQFCTLNASAGPVYIGRNAEIMEGSAVRGPFVLGDHSVLKLNSHIYGATTLGPFCAGGGEIKNSVLMGYSNKAHDGYLGDSVIGEWCNFGAGSTNSNLKNTAGEIKVWDMDSGQYLSAGQKCGVIMGDYSRAAINSAINTGSVIGVSSHVFGVGLLPTIVSSFRWGVSGTGYEFPKALADIGNWKKLKGRSLSEEETSVLKYIFDATNELK